MERFAIKIDKNLRANLYKICRLCGIDNPDKVKVLDDESIVNLEEGEPELWKKVLDCIGLLITKDDKMPQFMCTLCVDKINDFFEFREMCYATDGQTRKLLGIKEEPKLKTTQKSSTSVDCKAEDQDVKQPLQDPVISAQRPSRKRRNADMEICNTSREIKTDDADDVKPATSNTINIASKKKRLKLDSTDTDIKPIPDIKPGSLTKSGSASKIGPASKVGLSKKRLKIEASTSKEKKDVKPAKITKLMKKSPKAETSFPPVQDERKPITLQMQKKKKALELLKQRKLAKKVAVVKVEKLRKGSVESKIKEEAPVPAPAPGPTQPKVKLKDKCAICNEGFVNKVLLDKHIKSTHIPYIARYHCVQCNETLKKNMEIKNHNLWHKLSKTPFQCGNCSESSCSIYTYSKHIRDCGQVSYIDAHIPDWHCPECNGVFETTYLFNIHSCVANTLVCPGCDRSLKWKEDYFKHIPTCTAAVHRIPPYMTSNIQVKNEAENPISPLPPHNTHVLSATTNSTVQPTPPSRITPPLMDSNQCVVIPGNVNLLEEASSPSSKSSSRKSKRITKKDLKRFDKLLKSTMTTLVSIKQEPAQGDDIADDDQSISSDVRVASPSPPGSPAAFDDDYHHNDDDDDSADEQTSSQPVGSIKQEVIDEGYRDLYNNIEVNIKREVVVNENRSAELATPKKTGDSVTEKVIPTEPIAPKPVLKLKITKEHGMLNSVLLDSPKSEKKKKKKKRKEERLKAAEKEESNAVQEITTDITDDPHASDAPNNTSNAPDIPDMTESVEEEPAMPLPQIIRIKEEITEPDEEEEVEEQLSSQSSHNTPSIVAATSGALQISCVSEGVHFNGPEENDNEEEKETSESVNEQPEQEDDQIEETVECEDLQEEIDIKPRLEDIIPMLQITSVSSGEDLIKKPGKTIAKTKRRQTPVAAKPSTSTPQIVSVSSGSEVVPYQPDPEKASEDVEETFEKMDSNENVFDYTQVLVKEEVVDPAYDQQDCEMPGEDVEEQEEDEDEVNEEMKNTITNKQAEENAYIANIDFNNLSIKQETEYIDDGLDNPVEDDNSDTDSESSSDTEDNNSESEREYRELPSEDDESQLEKASTPVVAPLGLQISAVHSEFTCDQPQLDEKTESQLGLHLGSEDKTKSNSTTEYGDLEIDGAKPTEDQMRSRLEEAKETTEKLPEENSKLSLEGDDEDEEKMQSPAKLIESSPNHDLDLSCDQAINHSISTISISEVRTALENPSSVDTNAPNKMTHYVETNLTELNDVIAISNLEDQGQPSTISRDISDLAASDIESKSPVNEFDWCSALETNKPIIPTVADDINVSITETFQEFDDLSTGDVEPKPSTSTASVQQTSHQPTDSVAISTRDLSIDDGELSTFSNELIDQIPSSADGLSTLSGEIDRISCDSLLDDADLLKCDRKSNALICPESTAEIRYAEISKLRVNPAEVCDIPQVLESKTQMSDTSLAMSELIGQTASGPIQDQRATLSHEMEVSTLSVSTSVAGSSDVNRIVEQTPSCATQRYDDDIVMSEIEPPVSDIGRLIDHTPSPAMTQQSNVLSSDETVSNLLGFPARIAATSQSTIGTIITDDVEDHASLSLINFQARVTQPNDIVPYLDHSHLSTDESEEILLPKSVQSVIGSQQFSTLSHSIADQKSTDNYVPMDSNKPIDSRDGGNPNSFKEIEQKITSTQPLHCEPPPIVQCTSPNTEVYSNTALVSHFSSSIPTESATHHAGTSSSEITNEISISIDLSDVLTTSTLPVPIAVLTSERNSNEFNPNSHIISEPPTNIPIYSTELHRFNSETSYADTNLNLTELCTTTPTIENLTQFQVDLTVPTAEQLHTLITTATQPPLISELSRLSSSSLTSDTDLSVPVLSEEVQNLLNEDTVAANNFEQNDSILRARCSTSTNAYSPLVPSVVSVPNYTDLENVNEIAENNNNANIERELQDELGNVLAAAIADRSPNDEADENNVMNENRANFDIA